MAPREFVTVGEWLRCGMRISHESVLYGTRPHASLHEQERTPRYFYRQTSMSLPPHCILQSMARLNDEFS